MYIYMYNQVVKRYTIAEARSQFARIIGEAERGQSVELTRRGKPVAVVMSCQEVERLKGQRADFSELYDAFIARHDLQEVGIDDEFIASLRDRNPGREVTL